MKKLTLLLFVAILLTACGPAPQDLVNSWQEAMNKGDIDAALSYLAADATVTIVPAFDGDGVYNGHVEIRGWYEPLFAAKGVTTLSGCKVEGETVTCLDNYADEGLKSMGVDFIEGDFVAVVRDGKIQSYTVTFTPESLAKFPPPPEPTPSAPVEALASSIDDLLGVWWFTQAGLNIEIKVDGTYRVFYESETVDEGNYTFDSGKITWVTGHPTCGDKPATYEVYITKQDGKPAWLRLQVVGTDPCSSRASVTGKAKFLNP